MLKNYFIIAWRNLLRYRFISLINIFGITVGLTCCLLILTYIFHELSYDKYNEKADRIYRVTRSFNTDDGVVTLHLGTLAPPFGPLLQNYFPDVEKMTRLLPSGTTPLGYKEKLFNEQDVYFADENLFDLFTGVMVKGNPKKALENPFSMMMTEEMAQKYFGNEDPIGKTIRYNNQADFTVAGIYKAFPSNAHIHPAILFSFNTLKDTTIYGEENLRTNWGNNSFLTYLLLPKDYPVEKIASQFPTFLDKNVHFKDAAAGYKPSKNTSLFFQKLTDIHLYSHLDYEAEENGDIKRVYIFSAIALFILLIACINYMNLSTARSALRAREIGVRKAIGAKKKELVAQFLSESVLVSLGAMLLAILLTIITLPWLNKISGLNLSFQSILQWKIIAAMAAVPLFVGLLSGIYPALFMSSFKTVNVLKAALKVSGKSISFRKMLVVTQFGISIILIICTAVVFQQLRFMQNTDLGYTKDHMVIIPYNDAITPVYESFRHELMQHTGIVNTARSSRIPTGRLLDAHHASMLVGDSMQPVSASLKFVATDYDFIPAYNIAMKAGRNFSRSFQTDTSSFILNEAAVSALGWKKNADAVGKDFIYGGVRGHIIGVMDNFHFESMHQKILPLVLVLPKPDQGGLYGNLSVKISGGNPSAQLAVIEKLWRKYLPALPYQFTFLDENFNKLYQSEQRQASIFTIFACIAIFIACLGLFGLSAFAISQRIKEIGIRKVLGASTRSLVKLLAKDFLFLVIIASIISFPVAWYAMHAWLQDFAYRIHIAWWIFLLAAIISAIVAIATVSIQAVKAAISNPVKNLRTE